MAASTKLQTGAPRRFGSFLRYIRRMYGRSTPVDTAHWHKQEPFIPVRLMDGSWYFFGPQTIWRRWNGNTWEYQASEESPEEGQDRQW